MPAIDVFWLNHSMTFLPDRGALTWQPPMTSNTFTISSISQSRSVTFAAIAGVVRSGLFILDLAARDVDHELGGWTGSRGRFMAATENV